MMYRLLLSFGLLACSSANVTTDFMRAMNEAKQMKNQEAMQRKLMDYAVPRKLANDDDANAAAALNITDYAMKYVGCQNIRSFSDDLAEDGDSGTVLGLNKFVVFRMCPADQCSSYNKYGCQYNFGEYVIEMDYYLQIMAEYHYQQQIEYCATCLECMSPPQDLDDDYVYATYNETDDSIAYNATVNETVAWNPVTDCDYYLSCMNYERACSEFVAPSDDDGNNIEEKLGCQKFQVGNTVGYYGPHCADDGLTIEIGIFRDEYCEEYIGDEIDLAYYTGNKLDDSWLTFYSNPSCIACTNEDSYALFNDDATGKAVYEMCEVLYDASGKCNRYLDVMDEDETYQSSQQDDNELKVCNFVESLMENNYDEFGDIIVLDDEFSLSKWNSLQAYKNEASKASGLQIFGLIFSVSCVLGLLSYSVYLYSQIRFYQEQYKPSLYQPGGSFSRNPSGIMMMRSGSGSSKGSRRSIASLRRQRSRQRDAPV